MGAKQEVQVVGNKDGEGKGGQGWKRQTWGDMEEGEGEERCRAE